MTDIIERMKLIRFTREDAVTASEALHEIKTLRAELAQVAALAHYGGLAGLSEPVALKLIRLLTLRRCDNSGTLRDLKDRVDAAIIEAGGDKPW